MIYLASPYSHPDPLIMRTRFLLAEQVVGIALANRQWIYSPIVHCHEIACKIKLPTDFAFWRDYNFDMLRRADEVWFLAISGWDQSVGVTAELDMARDLGMKIKAVNETGDFLDGQDFQHSNADAINGTVARP